MLKIKDFSKVLVEYKRTPDRLTSYVGKDEEGRPTAKLQLFLKVLHKSPSLTINIPKKKRFFSQKLYLRNSMF